MPGFNSLARWSELVPSVNHVSLPHWYYMDRCTTDLLAREKFWVFPIGLSMNNTFANVSVHFFTWRDYTNTHAHK